MSKKYDEMQSKNKNTYISTNEDDDSIYIIPCVNNGYAGPILDEDTGDTLIPLEETPEGSLSDKAICSDALIHESNYFERIELCNNNSHIQTFGPRKESQAEYEERTYPKPGQCGVSYLFGNNNLQPKDIIKELRRKYFRSFAMTKATNKQKSKKKTIKILGDESFSKTFNDLIGNNNVFNMSDEDNDFERIRIFRAFIEFEVLACFQNKNNNILNEIVDVLRQIFYASFEVNGCRFIWKLCMHINVSGFGFVDLISKIFSCSHIDAIATLGNIVNIHYNKIFNTCHSHLDAEASSLNKCRINIPDILIGYLDEKIQNYMELIQRVNIYGYGTQIIGAITLYKSAEVTLCLPATVGNCELCIGKYNPHPFLLNQHLFDTYKDSTIFLCEDMRTAIEIDSIISKQNSDLKHKFLPSAFIGNDLDAVSWNYFFGRNVVFIPVPTKKGLAGVQCYMLKLVKAKVKAFSIYQYPVLHSSCKDFLESCDAQLSLCEYDLLKNAVVIKNEKSPLSFLQRIVDEALEYSNFKAWGRGKNIFVSRKNVKATTLNTEDLFSDNLDICDKISENFSYDNFKAEFILGGITVIHGLKESGKSLLGLLLIKELIAQQNICALFDFETLPGLAKTRLLQLELYSLRKKFFFPIFKLAASSDSIWKDMILTEKNYYSLIDDFVKKCNAQLVIIDNIVSSLGGKADDPVKVATVMDFAATFIQENRSVILLHHTQDNTSGKASGSHDWIRRCHTEIHLLGSKQILNCEFCSSEIHQYASQPGATFGLHIKSCKMYHLLKDKIFWFHLPDNHNTWLRLGSSNFNDTYKNVIIDNQIPNKTWTVDNELFHENNKKLNNISPQEFKSDEHSDCAFSQNQEHSNEVPSIEGISYKANTILKKFRGQDVQRSEIDIFLDCTENTSRKYLNELVNAGLATNPDSKQGIFHIM